MLQRSIFLLFSLTLVVRAGSAAGARCDFELNEGRRLLFEARLTNELRLLRKTNWILRLDRVNAIRALFRSNHGFDLDAETVRFREAISSDVLERRADARRGPHDNFTLTLAVAFKLYGRVLAERDDAYLVALPPPAGEYLGYQFMPFDLYFVMPLKSHAWAGSRARAVRRRVSEGVSGVSLGVNVYGTYDEDEDDVGADWNLIDEDNAAIYAERLLSLTTDDLIVHPSYRRAALAF